MQAVLPCRSDRILVSSISMPGNTNARIIGEHPLETKAHLGSPVGNDDLAGVKR